MVDQNIGTDTTITLRSPPSGSFSVALTNPSGEQVTLTKEPEITNWNALASTVGVTWNRIPNAAVSNLASNQLKIVINYKLSCFELRISEVGITPSPTTLVLIATNNLKSIY